MKRHKILFISLTLAVIVLFFTCMMFGSIHIPADALWGTHYSEMQQRTWRFILIESRLPAALCALTTGASLAVGGLLLQSYFRNPLAGPSILGITSGANLGVAIIMLAGVSSFAGITSAALAGALLILGFLVFLSHLIRQQLTLLIVGILVSYLTGSAITLLSYQATAEGVRSYLIWGMGSFTGLRLEEMPFYAGTLVLGLLSTIWLIKPLNAWLLGDAYAQNLGIHINQTRLLILLITGLLTAVTTAYCGPISFIGLSIPHVARLLFRSDDHKLLLPATALCGSATALLCHWICSWPADGRLLPINAITPIIGVPVILYILIRKR